MVTIVTIPKKIPPPLILGEYCPDGAVNGSLSIPR